MPDGLRMLPGGYIQVLDQDEQNENKQVPHSWGRAGQISL